MDFVYYPYLTSIFKCQNTKMALHILARAQT